MIQYQIMVLTEKQREGLGKTFLDVFKFLIVGLLLSDSILKAPMVWKVTVAIAAVASLLIGTILHR